MRTPKYVAKTLEMLEKNRIEAYLVGGCVRDSVMDRRANDYDIAVGAKPEDILNIFPKSIPSGIKYGTVTVISDGKPLELTSFRGEGGYPDHRHPADVYFTDSILTDLSRDRKSVV